MAGGPTFRNPVLAGGPSTDHGDPFVIKFLDEFFLYHTGETSGRRGVSVHRSPNLIEWEFQGYALEAAETGWAWADLWAPEVVYERGTFYMYFSARSRDAGPSTGPWQFVEGEAGRRLGLARASSPVGPFVPDEQPLVDVWSIDGHPFRDDDGTMWLFYNVRSGDGPWPAAVPGTGTVCDRLLSPDRLEGRPAPVTFPSERWEGVPTGDWFWNEAPYVLKRRARYYQMYSGGSFSDSSYAIGIAEALAPRGPWVKHADNPIMVGGERIVGPGHHSFIFGRDVATQYAVYHGYVVGAEGRKVHLDRLFWSGERPFIDGPTEDEQPMPPGPVFDARVPHWRAEAWVRGSWVEVCGHRFGLAPTDVWHQVEAVQSAGRLTVRVGGVLRSSRPVFEGRGPAFRTDGDLRAESATSHLDDGALHDLPAGSSYVWRWGGTGPLELSLAVKGAVGLELDGKEYELEGGDERYGLFRLEHDGRVEDIVARARSTGASVTDLSVFARQ